MTLKELEEKKKELRKKVENAKPEEMEELRKEIEVLQDVKIEEETKEIVDERNLLKGAIEDLEKRNLSNAKVIEKPSKEERKMEEKNIYETEEYRSAFLKKLQGKKLNEKEERAMTTATTSTGTTIPTTTLNKIEEMLRQTSALYNMVDVLNIPGYLSIPVEDTVNDASWIAEGENSTDVNDKLKSVNFAAYKLIRTISITAEVSKMTVSAFENWIVKKITNRMAMAIENAILNGTGNGQPKGILKEEITTLETSEAGKFSYEDICKIMANLKAGYKKGSAFVVNTQTLWNDIVTIKIGDNLAFVPDATGEFAGRIFGKPVIEDEFIGEGKILYGLFDKYTINWNENVNVTSDDSAEFRSGNRVYRGMALVDGKTVNTEAFVLMNKKTGASV
ncbi:MAG: phage major capsid protein [Clostridia bacterium]|jgi:HK97 family phage major capsid protein|nr:phage major capsid protein [Clostridia bacterium]